jgi:hypothetical protein
VAFVSDACADAARRIVSLLGDDGAGQFLKLLEQDESSAPTPFASCMNGAAHRRSSTR